MEGQRHNGINQLTWLKGAVYLSLAAFIAKGLSALYKIPYQNITGDRGFYVYQQVYPIYGVAFVLGTYGFPLVISRMIAQENTEFSLHSHTLNTDRLTFIFVCLFFLHTLIGGSVMVMAEPLAMLMGDPNLTEAIRWMGPSFFLIPFLALGRGVYQGIGAVTPSAISQVLEQAIRVVVILLIAIMAMKQNDPYLAGNSAGIGAIAGGLAGVTLFLLLAVRYRQSFTLSPLKLKSGWSKTWRADLKELLLSGIFVSISAMVLVIFQLTDTFTVFRQLITSGLSHSDAAIQKGIYDRGWPLVQFGAVVTTVFSYAAVPVIAKAFEHKNFSEVKDDITSSVKVCIVFGGAAAAGMSVIMPSLNKMMFMDQAGTVVLQVFAWVVFFGALFMTTAALLHAVGKSGLSALVLLIGCAVKLALNWWLIVEAGILGAAVSSVIAMTGMVFLSLYILSSRQLWRPLKLNFWVKWFVSLAIMTLVVNLYLWGFSAFTSEGRLNEAVKAITASIFGGVIFLFLIKQFKIFTKNEWESIPKIGRKIPY
ncbi:polysaccharide biosynthesis protein [Salipaludibacillus sp. LMS25]|jgi:PST family polysaccharide transporter|uniref:putative polysaccharide biosynthesis protein n=1 Tax=Salipaludibacillus sp. LMS25 TaxID=2924031 RepID=UPI0020D0A027|nr:polysaccharide biosynthesis protein [Salipaludibacillus sp. LMS25]UTR16657.1 polysaccharide biosynthesis protein [Salipaludibacillus sp. LMS25]